MTETTLYSIAEVARILKKQPYHIAYVLNTGKLPEPKMRIGNRRAFDGEDIQRLYEYFHPEQHGGNQDE